MISNFNFAFADEKPKEDAETTQKPNISVTNISSQDFLVEANQTTLMQGYDRHQIEVRVKNQIDTSKFTISNLTAKASIANPDSVHIVGSGIIELDRLNYWTDNNEMTFFIDLSSTPVTKKVTVPINITLEYTKTEEGKEPSVGSETTTIYVVQEASLAPENSMIEIKKFDIFPLGEISPGQNFDLVFEVYNPGNAPAKNIKLSLDGLTAEGVNMATGLNTQDITVLPPKSSSTVVYSLTTPASAIGGKFPLTLKYTFNGKTPTDGDTTAPQQGEYQFSIDLKKSSMAPSTLIFEKIDFPKATFGKNAFLNIGFTLKNIGKFKAQNINIAALSKEITGLSPKSASNIVVPEMAPGESREFNFSFQTTNAISTQNYPVDITVTYVDDSTTKEAHTITQTVGVNAVNWEEEEAKNKDKPSSVPKLIIEKYSFDKDSIYAGTDFNLNLVLYNTSSKKTIKNIKIFLTSETLQSNDQTKVSSASVFTPIESSNTFFIDSIAPKQKVEKTIKLSTSRDTVAKTYTLTANIEYEDEQSKPYTSSEIIGIPVYQDAQLKIGEIIVDPEFQVGMPGMVSVEFYNTGKVTLSNFMVSFEGKGLKTDSPNYYKGNFAVGTSDTFSVYVSPESAENNSGKITFTYEDSTGLEHKEEKEFTLNVVEMPMPSEDEMLDKPPENGGGSFLKPLIIGIAIVAAVVLFIIFRRHKKKKSEEDLTIDEDK